MSDVPDAQDDHLDGPIAVFRRGLQVTPELLDGLRATSALGLLVALGQVAGPIVIQQAIDRGGLGDGNVNIGTVWRIVLLGAAVIVSTQVIGVLARRRMIRRAESSLCTLRTRAFERVHRMSLAEHNEQSTGVLISRVTSDVDALSRFIDWGIFAWLVQPFVVVGAFAAMAYYSWVLALVALLAFVPAVFLLRWMQTQMGRAHDERRTAIGDLLGAYSEALAGSEVVRAYAAEPRTKRRLNKASDHRYRSGLRANLFMSAVYIIGDLIGAVMMALILVVGVSQREALGLSASELIAILFLTTLLHTPVAELGESLNNAQQAVSGWRKVLGLLDRPIDDLDPQSGESLPAGPLAIDAVDVNFDYGDGDRVLHDVCVSIPAGSRVAVVGETGSGKSTFGRLLCRLADPTSGSIKLSDVDLRDVEVDSRHAAVRMVPQDGFLFDVTIAENIAYGRPDADRSDVLAAIEMLGLTSWVAALPGGLDTPVGERGRSLSVGERQLVSFARAAVASPGLLILDEATSSVDPQTDVMLTESLQRLSEGRTVVSIAHRLSTAEAADIIVVFDQGRIVEHGHHDELLSLDGVYSGQYAAWTAATAAAIGPA